MNTDETFKKVDCIYQALREGKTDKYIVEDLGHGHISVRIEEVGCMDNRYQYQPRYVKLWRSRWKLLILFEAISLWVKGEDRFGLCLSLARGLCDMRMNNVYTFEELKERMRSRVREYHNKRRHAWRRRDW